jgi:hypothetical protein
MFGGSWAAAAACRRPQASASAATRSIPIPGDRTRGRFMCDTATVQRLIRVLSRTEG